MNSRSVSKIVTKLSIESFEEELKLIAKDQEKKEKGNTNSPISAFIVENWVVEQTNALKHLQFDWR